MMKQLTLLLAGLLLATSLFSQAITKASITGHWKVQKVVKEGHLIFDATNVEASTKALQGQMIDGDSANRRRRANMVSDGFKNMSFEFADNNTFTIGGFSAAGSTRSGDKGSYELDVAKRTITLFNNGIKKVKNMTFSVEQATGKTLVVTSDKASDLPGVTFTLYK